MLFDFKKKGFVFNLFFVREKQDLIKYLKRKNEKYATCCVQKQTKVKIIKAT